MLPADPRAGPSDSRVRRLRLHVLEHLGEAQPCASTVFCPGRLRSVDLDTCRRCPRLLRIDDDAVECVPPLASDTRDLSRKAHRIGDGACVGDAAGSRSVVVPAAIPYQTLLRALDERCASVAMVVDDEGRVQGVVDVHHVACLSPVAPAGRCAWPTKPLREDEPLVIAVDRMVRERARALPVVNPDGEIVALLTDLDLLRWVAQR